MDRKVEAPVESPDGKVKVKKWPSEVVLSQTQVFSEKAFFYWTHREKTSSFWGWLIVGLVLGIMLFPLWPMFGKIAVFYISLYLLIFLVKFAITKLAAILLRVLLYMIIRPFGYEFWVLPEIFDDNFFPLYSFTKAEDGLWGYLFRVFIFLFIGYLFYEVSRDPTVIKDYVDTAAQSHDDIVSWGRIKLGIDKSENPLGNAISYDKVLIDEDLDEANSTETNSQKTTDDRSNTHHSKSKGLVNEASGESEEDSSDM